MPAELLVRHPTRFAVVGLLILCGCENPAPISSSNNSADGTGGTAGVTPTSGGGGFGPGAAGGNGAPIAGAMAGGGPASGSGAGSAGTNGWSPVGGTGGPVGAGGGSGGASGSAAGNNPLDKGNYFQSGAWQGYVWTAANGAGSTISPMDFSAQPTGMPRCVMGSVAAAADYSGTAVLGFNLSEGTGVTAASVTPTRQGVLLMVDNKRGSPLRFQVKSASGTEWCTPLSGAGGFIPWTSLKTACWGSTGTAYASEPIVSAMVLVPGTNTTAVPFEFCVNGLVESDAPSGGMAGAGSGGEGGTSGATGGGSGGSSGGSSGNGGPTVPPLQNGCNGYATRYWDCCKPHCGWSANAPTGPLASCDRSDNSHGGNYDVGNACGAAGSAYLCHSQGPWAVSGSLAYGFAAVAASAASGICGKCYQLEFTGTSHNAGSDPGSFALRGKSMIVQAINIGGDVAGGQFDLAIPGGGVGQFDGCTKQWGVDSSQLGAPYGGFLAACKREVSASDHGALKSCVMQRCSAIFDAKGLTELAAACRWFVDWFEVADNPSIKYAEVPCPNALMDRGMRRGGGGGAACLR